MSVLGVFSLRQRMAMKGVAGASRVLGVSSRDELNIKSDLPPLTEAFHLVVPIFFFYSEGAK